MARRRRLRWLLAGGIVLILLAVSSPWIVSAYWRKRSSNPVRRGVALATELGCFTCHGEFGRAGIPDPRDDEPVPRWTGGVWMMYVEGDADIRRIILEGSESDRAIGMPAYRDVLDTGDLDDLVAAFKVVSGMVGPPRGSPARAGLDVALEWKCFACHGAAASGGRPNPRSFTGFVPGWYGADFEDLVRDRPEFDQWVTEGTIPRLANHPVASFVMARQRLTMPAYSGTTPQQLDDLWAYTQWLSETHGGRLAEIKSW